jgi:hypothetical protein
VLNSTDGWNAELASKISAKFSLPQRDVLHLVRNEFRNFRSVLAAAMRQQAEMQPELIEDELPEPEPTDELQ